MIEEIKQKTIDIVKPEQTPQGMPWWKKVAITWLIIVIAVCVLGLLWFIHDYNSLKTATNTNITTNIIQNLTNASTVMS